MKYRRFVLDPPNRDALAAMAIACFVAAFTLTPTAAGSRLSGSTLSVSAPNRHRGPVVPAGIIPSRDAFAPRVNEDDAADVVARETVPAALPPPSVLPANRAAGAFPFATGTIAVSQQPRVTALALGPHPSAVLEQADGRHIVNLGDRAAGSTVQTIDVSGVILADGRRISFAQSPGDGAP